MNTFIERISHFFTDNRALSLLLLMAVLVLGLAAFLAMPKQYNPEIVRPAFVVTINYQGATPQETMERVGYELTEQLQVIPGIEDILTTVSDGAVLSSTIIFAVGVDVGEAKADVLSQLESNQYQAGGAVGGVMLQEINPETIPVLQVAISSQTKTVQEVRQFVQSLRGKLLATTDVSEVTIIGGDAPAVMVEIDPVRLETAGISLSTVVNVLGASSGRLSTAGFETMEQTAATTFSTQVHTIEEVSVLPLSPTVSLRDVATVYEGVSPRRSYTLYSDTNTLPTEVVMLGVAKREGSSAPVVTAAVRDTLDEAFAVAPGSDFNYRIVSDDGEVASKEIMGLTTNLITSIVIVAIILFLFLSPRSALVVLITVPLTFLAVLAVGFVVGETMNRITLFALILSLGLLVDASIVVVDVMYEHINRAASQGRVVKKAVLAGEAISEVGMGLVLSAVTSVVVFLPMFYITGMMGPYMGPIAFFVPVALIASLFIAIMLTPFIATGILRADEKDNIVSAFSRRQMERLTRAYSHVLRRIVEEKSFRRILLWSVWAVLAISFILPTTGLVHFQMLPKANRDQLYVYIDMPTGTSREATVLATKSVNDLLIASPLVESVQSFVATGPIVDFNGLFKGAPTRTAPEQATLRVNLITATNRKESSSDVTRFLRAEVKEKLGRLANSVRFMEEPPGPPVLATFVAKVSGSIDRQQEVSTILQDRITKVTGVVDIDTSIEDPSMAITYTFDKVAAAQYGVSPDLASLWYETVTGPKLVGEALLPKADERMAIYLTTPSAYRSAPDLLSSVVLDNQKGVTLADVVTPNYHNKISDTHYEGAVPVSYVTAEVEERSIVYVMIELITALVRDGLPQYKVTNWGLFGLTFTHDSGEVVTLTWGGEWEMTLENFRDLGVAMSVALLLVYGVLVAQYRSFKTPGLILVTVPLGLIGILWGFLVIDVTFGIYLTATALIGFIALIGIVVNNAIIYLEYVEQALAEGTAYGDALVAAGTLRLRPILLTSLTTVLGSLTIASDPVWSGLAWSFVFGLSLSTALTLVVLPALLMNSYQENK